MRIKYLLVDDELKAIYIFMINKVSALDIGSIPVPVFFRGKASVRSFYCSIVSFVAIGILLIYSFTKLSTLGSVIQYSSHQINDFPEITLTELSFNLKIYRGVAPIEDNNGQYISNKNMYENGLNITVFQVKNENSTVTTKESYMQDVFFNGTNYFQYLTLPKNLSKRIKTVSMNNNSFFGIQIKPCNKSQSIQCIQMKKQIDYYLNISYQMDCYDAVSINDSFIKLETKEDQAYVSISQYNWFYSSKNLFFGSYQLQSDRSIWPKFFGGQKTIKSWSYNQLQSSQSLILQNFYEIYFFAKTYTEYETQRMQKIDQLLPQIFTFFSLMVLIVKFISFDYRFWSTKMHVVHRVYGEEKRAEDSIFATDERKLLGINVKNYFRLRFKKEQNLDQLERVTKSRLKKAQHKMDYLQIVKQMHDMKKMIRVLCRKSKMSQQQLRVEIENQPESQDEYPQVIKKSNTNTLLSQQSEIRS